jgi:glucan phosphoethanolaminetransferase (alkaline phosphatase superfamily)
MNFKTAWSICTYTSVLLIVFHLMILVGVVPANIVWGGNITTPEMIYPMELIALTISSYLLLILLAKNNKVSFIPSRVVSVSLWVFFAYFLLNTIGNLLAKTVVEQSMALVTILLATCIFYILRPKQA